MVFFRDYSVRLALLHLWGEFSSMGEILFYSYSSLRARLPYYSRKILINRATPKCAPQMIGANARMRLKIIISRVQ